MGNLSVVLISKNQEWNMARLIESVLRETDSLPWREIVLVDSASTDRTTEIAAQYPIRVLKLRPDQRLTAAAGRYVGFGRTTGDLVLFLDGDMELAEGWLDQALDLMESEPEVAVVCGRVIDRPEAMRTPVAEAVEALEVDGGGKDVAQSGGAAMYRRSVLERVGTFNPYLYSDEEPELCLRIRRAGYRVHRLSRPIAFHYSARADAFSTLFGKRRRNLWLGYGQNIRYLFGSSLLLPYLKERGWAVPPALVLGLGLVAAAASVQCGQWRWLGLWAAIVLALAIGTIIRKRSLRRALFSLFQRLLVLDGTMRGLFLKPYDPAGYPGRYDVIR